MILFFIESINEKHPLAGNINGLLVVSVENRNPHNCKSLDNRVFENFILANKPVAKALRIFGTCVIVNNNSCVKTVSSLKFPIKFDERFKVTSVPFCIADFNLLIVN